LNGHDLAIHDMVPLLVWLWSFLNSLSINKYYYNDTESDCKHKMHVIYVFLVDLHTKKPRMESGVPKTG